MAAVTQIIIAGPIDAAGQALLDARPELDCALLERPSAAEIDAHIEAAEGLLLRITPFTAGTITRARRLRVVSRFGVGYDNVDVPALTERGIPLTITGDANAVTVAELTLGLMLAVARRLVALDARARVGDYAVDAGAASDLSGKTALVVGFGRVGRRVAKRCQAFDMMVIVADPFVSRNEIEGDGYHHVADVNAAIDRADFVTLHLPAQPDGRPVMGPEQFARMKPGAYLVNAARGSLVDEAALHRALAEGRLGGAALDVLRDEPPAPDNPLLALDSVILTPHCASLTNDCIRRMSVVAVQNLLDGIDGRLRLEFVVNRATLAPGSGW